jgi:hypothetical protein
MLYYIIMTTQATMDTTQGFTITPEIRAAMAECKWKGISKNTKQRIGHAQMMRELESGPMGHKISRLDRATGKPMGVMMSDADMIRHENELRKFCLFMKKQNQQSINHLLSKKNGGIGFGARNQDAMYYIQQMYASLFASGDFGRVGGGPKDWKIGWMGSRWRDIKCHRLDDDGAPIVFNTLREEQQMGKVVIRAAYYGPRSNCVGQNKQAHPEDKTGHFITFDFA